MDDGNETTDDGQDEMVMKLLLIILAANLLTLVITIMAAIKSALWSYRSIALAALAACLFSLYQVQTGTIQPLSLLFTTIVIALVTFRVFANWRYGRK